MISDSAALVMFAMRSSIKRGLQRRQTYVDSTQRRELVLLLPNFFSSTDIVSATNYFAGPGQTSVAQSPQLADLLQKRQTAGQNLTPDEEAEVLTCHIEFVNLDLAKAGTLGSATDGTTLTGGEFNSRQSPAHRGLGGTGLSQCAVRRRWARAVRSKTLSWD